MGGKKHNREDQKRGGKTVDGHTHTHTHTHKEREREREAPPHTHTHTHTRAVISSVEHCVVLNREPPAPWDPEVVQEPKEDLYVFTSSSFSVTTHSPIL